MRSSSSALTARLRRYCDVRLDGNCADADSEAGRLRLLAALKCARAEPGIMGPLVGTSLSTAFADSRWTGCGPAMAAGGGVCDSHTGTALAMAAAAGVHSTMSDMDDHSKLKVRP